MLSPVCPIFQLTSTEKVKDSCLSYSFSRALQELSTALSGLYYDFSIGEPMGDMHLRGEEATKNLI
jgi:hypothetical protein